MDRFESDFKGWGPGFSKHYAVFADFNSNSKPNKK